jgi:hypothetical protein
MAPDCREVRHPDGLPAALVRDATDADVEEIKEAFSSAETAPPTLAGKEW